MAGQNFIDVVLYNNRRPSKALLKKYGDDGELPVELTAKERKVKTHFKLIGANLIAKEIAEKSAGDTLKRSFILHSPNLIADNILKQAALDEVDLSA
jgi:hypothetical protein